MSETQREEPGEMETGDPVRENGEPGDAEPTDDETGDGDDD